MPPKKLKSTFHRSTVQCSVQFLIVFEENEIYGNRTISNQGCLSGRTFYFFSIGKLHKLSLRVFYNLFNDFWLMFGCFCVLENTE